MSKEKPCDGCNKEESSIFREGKIKLRFIRANKKPRGAMRNYIDGQEYWMYPRHARMPWWKAVDEIDYPIVPPATEKESAIIIGDLDDMEKPAYIGKSGISIKPGIGVVGGFVEPVAGAQEEPEDFPEEAPTRDWTKEKLVAFIMDHGGVAKREMRKSWLVEIALNLSQA